MYGVDHRHARFAGACSVLLDSCSVPLSWLRMVVWAISLLAVAATAVHAGDDLAPWVDSSVGIHTILIGDGEDTDAEIKAMATAGDAPDFICRHYATYLPAPESC